MYTLLPLHRAFHVAHAWPNSRYEDINEILYRPRIVPGDGAEHVCGGSTPIKPPLLLVYLNVGFLITVFTVEIVQRKPQ